MRAGVGRIKPFSHFRNRLVYFIHFNVKLHRQILQYMQMLLKIPHHVNPKIKLISLAQPLIKGYTDHSINVKGKSYEDE